MWLHEQAALHGRPGRNYWWVAPIIAQARIAYDRLTRYLPEGTFTTNKTNKTITLANGAVIWFKSGNDPDSLYGEDVYAAVIDEASRVKEDAWIAIRSTLTATQGPVRAIGNVKGRKNWFYLLARRAESGEPNMHYAKLTAFDAVKGGVISLEEVEDAKRVLPEQAFNELYLAIPGDDGSNPFGREAIEAAVADLAPTEPVTWGWDLARKRDWTVGIGLDQERRTCRLRRFQLPWVAQVKTIRKTVGWLPALVDSTGVGDAIVEQLAAEGRDNFRGYVFNYTSRQHLLEHLAYRISAGEVTFPQEVADELDEFEYVFTPGGRVKWAVPEGMHDDRAMSLALAVKHHGEGRPNLRFLDDDEGLDDEDESGGWDHAAPRGTPDDDDDDVWR